MGLLRGYGTSTRQSFILAVDWTVVVLMASNIMSVLMFPKELAFVRLRCDGRTYMNWRDHFVRRMMVRGLRRDQDLVDFALHAKALLRRTGIPKAADAARQLPATLRRV